MLHCMPTIDDVHRIFGLKDYMVFKWVFCKYICETGSDTFTDYELFSRSGLGAYMGDEESMKDFILDNQEDNIYKIFVRDVLESLVRRGFLRPVLYRETDGKNVLRYEKTPELKAMCPQFGQYMMGDINTLT
jgi:hypothetical protein